MMALKFAKLRIPGIHSRPFITPPQIIVVRDAYPGLRGETEIRLEYRGRPIRYDVLLFDSTFKDSKDVVDALKLFDQNVGVHGDLEETGNVPRTFRNVTFEGAVPLDDVKPDVGKGLVPGKQIYFVPVSLNFYQLSIEND